MDCAFELIEGTGQLVTTDNPKVWCLKQFQDGSVKEAGGRGEVFKVDLQIINIETLNGLGKEERKRECFNRFDCDFIKNLYFYHSIMAF